ncbi:flagellar hook-associated protein FlgK [Paenibacillus rhizovicinus]|uniref:Flagellar hook-associated protein 1 n=1 Tax=Paenibacillus rhizovicinus TaxID=2704463 RepID=A0A6C0P2K3_9BACL|nr:flagellar hook-associated protein FlgK [Paenibacillus rhizovicinus]QHW32591.1 flagellar hook-associated protein FlgK [Paenibacillus rhizovicinus]
MTSTFHTLETAKRSLFAQQTTINTIGHNIANANTEGYSRQRVTMVASRPMEAFGMQRSLTAGQLGTGVEATAIKRVRTAFLDDQFRNESKYVGSWSVQSDTLSKLESIVNEPSDSGIRSVMDKFYQAWSDLSKDPENVTSRKIIRETALALTDSFNQTSKQLSDLSSDLTSSIDVKATQANTYTDTISSLNSEIRRIESLGDDANDLRDQRDLLVDKLSQIVNVDVTELPDGYTVSMGGINLVSGNTTIPLDGTSLEAAYQGGQLNNGEAFGMIVSRDKYVADYQKQLDSLANTLANGEIQVTIPAGSVLPGTGTATTQPQTITVNGINGLHKLGYTLGDPATAGQDFFNFDTTSASGITAASIRLNPVIADDTNNIASSMRTTNVNGTDTVVKGNNTLALLMSELGEVEFSFDQSATGNGISKATLNNFYSSMVGGLGVQSEEAQRQYSNSVAQQDQVESTRQSVSGVSLDEEMSDLVKFQHAYSAAARFMTAFDEMLDKLINGTGQVGR